MPAGRISWPLIFALAVWICMAPIAATPCKRLARNDLGLVLWTPARARLSAHRSGRSAADRDGALSSAARSIAPLGELARRPARPYRRPLRRQIPAFAFMG